MAALHHVDIRNFYIESASFIQFSRRCRSPFVFFDTEFTLGCILRHSKHHTQLSPTERYSVLKLNANVIRPTQVGITISDGGTSSATWQFELQDFDLRSHPHAPGAISLLESSGINLTWNRQVGMPSAWLARLLLDAGLVGDLSKATWVAFHGCYDFVILFKALFQLTTKMRVMLPETMEEFMALTKWFFGGRIYDVKCLIRRCDGLYGGLEKVAEKLNVKRAVGKAHQAGSDSLLTCQVFLRMKTIYFSLGDDGKERKMPYEGLIFGLNN
ncbi:probable CCR4-associated factor 1 homolog 11 [Dendrobium catenatum]|uniref:Putative CCR4-associated factor 1 like 11 n=1 Tax=Dendrobium catenatum TaxID=906689 RepID=A0A2I0W7T8_9ASPA|nr:probable CCR4-associated factor 1 homolog 11 [Dendrobium catenatum]PKU71710.1 putative CCR4-associated factor 1 like 11 [Dendrobium catenatum]